MTTTTITGASDDLIELDGQIREEFSHYGYDDDQGCLLAFSDGTLLSIKYDDDGIWRIARLATGKCEYAHQPGDVVEDTNDLVTSDRRPAMVRLRPARAVQPGGGEEMTDTLYSMPMAPLLTHRIYQPRLLGKRVRNSNSGAVGRLSGEVRHDSGIFWLEVEAETGRWWWPESAVHALGAIEIVTKGERG